MHAAFQLVRRAWHLVSPYVVLAVIFAAAIAIGIMGILAGH